MKPAQLLVLVSVVLSAFCVPASVLALGSDYKKPPDPGPDWWAPALQKLVQNEHWVHGYLVNAEDRHFYAGSTEALNQFLQAYAQLDESRLEVMLHAGTKQAVSPWNESGKGPQADWALYIAPRDWLKHSSRTKVTDADPPTITRVDIWLGGKIDVDELRIPGRVTINAEKQVQADVVLRVQRSSGQSPSKASDRTSTAEDQENVTPDSDLRHLRTQRRDTLDKRLKLLQERYRTGQASYQQLVDALTASLEAQLELTEDLEQREKLLEKNVEVQRELEQRLRAEHEAGRTSRADVLTAVAERLAAEIRLLELRDENEQTRRQVSEATERVEEELP